MIIFSLWILRDKELSLIAVDGEKVIGLLYTSFISNVYSFDVIVKEDYRRKGIGRELIRGAIDDFQLIYGDIPEARLELDVVNKDLIPLLTEQGFIKVKEISPDRFLMRYGD